MIPDYREHDVVKSVVALGKIPIGSSGTIVFVYGKEEKVYEVEFVTPNGDFLGLETVNQEHIEHQNK